MAKKSRNEARLRRHRRVRKNISGSAETPGLNVFRSLTHIYAQVIDDRAGRTIASASTVDGELKTSFGGKSRIEQAELVGEAVARRAQDKGITQVVFDRGGFRYMGRVKALAEGARKGGLKF